MNDVISRQDAIGLLKKWSDGYSYIEIETNAAIKAFEDLPSAELKQKKGKWIFEKINEYTKRTYCSECKTPALFICVSNNHFGHLVHGKTKETNFCPDCGADMRGEEK